MVKSLKKTHKKKTNPSISGSKLRLRGFEVSPLHYTTRKRTNGDRWKKCLILNRRYIFKCMVFSSFMLVFRSVITIQSFLAGFAILHSWDLQLISENSRQTCYPSAVPAEKDPALHDVFWTIPDSDFFQ